MKSKMLTYHRIDPQGDDCLRDTFKTVYPPVVSLPHNYGVIGLQHTVLCAIFVKFNA
jgi:hypothetical protein